MNQAIAEEDKHDKFLDDDVVGESSEEDDSSSNQGEEAILQSRNVDILSTKCNSKPEKI